MGLFSRSKVEPAAPPSPIEREDIATAVAAAPQKEIRWITDAIYEIDFLSNALPLEEKVLGIAYCRAAASDTAGVIAFTAKRIVAIITVRGNRNQVVGEPTVHIFPFADLTGLSYRSDIQTPGYFDVRGQGQVTLLIGWQREWASHFMEAAKRQFNLSKF